MVLFLFGNNSNPELAIRLCSKNKGILPRKKKYQQKNSRGSCKSIEEMMTLGMKKAVRRI
ncbi:hypothetical protein C1631_006860 [Chryseobacterium phosphatilyticum]|uniref:Uncharacterized protein n=1 Tax=Chryseobacterium phosphatilyticum TaxID=475075 RepID=A0A316XEQ4_9FLAO|nr:hypothetical protein C1631_006860 [Chryseobacterium phosphatilyticum]